MATFAQSFKIIGSAFGPGAGPEGLLDIAVSTD